MAQEYLTLSSFGTHLFLSDYVDSDTIPSSVSEDDEIMGVLDENLGSFTKDTAKYRTLNGNGWESVVSLGQSAEDATLNMIRQGTGNVFTGTAGQDTYTRLKSWYYNATSDAGTGSPKVLTEIVPRGGTGANQWEATCYYVLPTSWDNGDKNTSDGQLYSITVAQFGPSVPVQATYVPASGDTKASFTLAKPVAA